MQSAAAILPEPGLEAALAADNWDACKRSWRSYFSGPSRNCDDSAAYVPFGARVRAVGDLLTGL